MTARGRLAIGMVAALLLVGGLPHAVEAQSAPNAGRAGARGARAGSGPAPVSVAEAERVFDRYMLGQARVALQLTPDQLVRFGQRFERLQALQRQRQRQRQRRLAELATIGRTGRGDEREVANLLRTIDQETAAADAQVRTARERLEEVLTVRQRARYRAFEARMEREKLRLISRARAEAGGDAAAPDDEASSAPAP